MKKNNFYVARDEDDILCLYRSKPCKVKEYGTWYSDSEGFSYFSIDSEMFPNVKWEDEEPLEVTLVQAVYDNKPKQNNN